MPTGAAAVLLRARPDLRESVADCGRLVGERAELDLDAVADRDPELATLLSEYWLRCRVVWDSLDAGHSGPAFTISRRRLASFQQVTGKTGRRDLDDVFDAAGPIGPLAAALDCVTDAEPDATLLERWAGTGLVTVSYPEPGQSVAVISVDGDYAYPQLLGGVSVPGQLRRVFTATVRHASWRDRRVRRLAAFTVDSDELWAAPADLDAAVGRLPMLG